MTESVQASRHDARAEARVGGREDAGKEAERMAKQLEEERKEAERQRREAEKQAQAQAEAEARAEAKREAKEKADAAKEAAPELADKADTSEDAELSVRSHEASEAEREALEARPSLSEPSADQSDVAAGTMMDVEGEWELQALKPGTDPDNPDNWVTLSEKDVPERHSVPSEHIDHARMSAPDNEEWSWEDAEFRLVHKGQEEQVISIDSDNLMASRSNGNNLHYMIDGSTQDGINGTVIINLSRASGSPEATPPGEVNAGLDPNDYDGKVLLGVHAHAHYEPHKDFLGFERASDEAARLQVKLPGEDEWATIAEVRPDGNHTFTGAGKNLAPEDVATYLDPNRENPTDLGKDGVELRAQVADTQGGWTTVADTDDFEADFQDDDWKSLSVDVADVGTFGITLTEDTDSVGNVRADYMPSGDPLEDRSGLDDIGNLSAQQLSAMLENPPDAVVYNDTIIPVDDEVVNRLNDLLALTSMAQSEQFGGDVDTLYVQSEIARLWDENPELLGGLHQEAHDRAVYQALNPDADLSDVSIMEMRVQIGESAHEVQDWLLEEGGEVEAFLGAMDPATRTEWLDRQVLHLAAMDPAAAQATRAELAERHIGDVLETWPAQVDQETRQQAVINTLDVVTVAVRLGGAEAQTGMNVLETWADLSPDKKQEVASALDQLYTEWGENAPTGAATIEADLQRLGEENGWSTLQRDMVDGIATTKDLGRAVKTIGASMALVQDFAPNGLDTSDPWQVAVTAGDVLSVAGGLAGSSETIANFMTLASGDGVHAFERLSTTAGRLNQVYHEQFGHNAVAEWRERAEADGLDLDALWREDPEQAANLVTQYSEEALAELSGSQREALGGDVEAFHDALDYFMDEGMLENGEVFLDAVAVHTPVPPSFDMIDEVFRETHEQGWTQLVLERGEADGIDMVALYEQDSEAWARTVTGYLDDAVDALPSGAAQALTTGELGARESVYYAFAENLTGTQGMEGAEQVFRDAAGFVPREDGFMTPSAATVEAVNAGLGSAEAAAAAAVDGAQIGALAYQMDYAQVGDMAGGVRLFRAESSELISGVMRTGGFLNAGADTIYGVNLIHSGVRDREQGNFRLADGELLAGSALAASGLVGAAEAAGNAGAAAGIVSGGVAGGLATVAEFVQPALIPIMIAGFAIIWENDRLEQEEARVDQLQFVQNGVTGGGNFLTPDGSRDLADANEDVNFWEENPLEQIAEEGEEVLEDIGNLFSGAGDSQPDRYGPPQLG